ncbi:MAG: hypothetical protein P4L83_21620 [Nevskia sp.]|nr:hypothetical protein [Nevskia sp.]
MRFSHLSRLLLALGFFAAQLVAVVHATGHELKPERSATCEICALAHAGGGPLAAVDASRIVIPRCEAPAAPVVVAVTVRSIARPNSRGPPLFLA